MASEAEAIPAQSNALWVKRCKRTLRTGRHGAGLWTHFRDQVGVGKEKITRNVSADLSQDLCLLRVNMLIQNMVAVLGAEG